MRCPSCGTLHEDSTDCKNLNLQPDVSQSDSALVDSPFGEATSQAKLSKPEQLEPPARSRLIEFPGTSRSSVPLWRKEIAERVREAQERKAREAANVTPDNSDQVAAPQLELLPHTEAAPINPLVAAALKRIERAYSDPTPSIRSGVNQSMAAVAYARGYEPIVEPSTVPVAPVLTHSDPEPQMEPPIAEPELPRTPNLVVLPSASNPVEIRTQSRSRKIISDDINSPALNYLDSVPTSLRVERPTNAAGPARRLFSGLIDLMFLAALYFPFAVSLELMQGGWRNLQVLGLALGTFLIIGFFYFTVSTGLTGRTLGMRLLGLRVVDVRTGLIPTGSQSASRSLLYLFSLLSAGLLFLAALLDSDHRTPHERYSRTAVVLA